MPSNLHHPIASAGNRLPDDRDRAIEQAIARAAVYLPTQGPIGVFVAQNILQGFEGEPFESAVVKAARVYGTEPFLPESVYRGELARGRIRVADVEAVLDDELGDGGGETLAGGRVTVRTLQLALMQHAVRQESDVAVRWTLSEGGAGDEAEAADLWHACVECVTLTRSPVAYAQPPVRLKDLILAIDPTLNTDALVHPLLIRMCGAFLDQGVAAWPMPGRERGLLAAVADIYSVPFGPTEPWNAGLPAALRAVRGRPSSAVIREELDRSGVPPQHHDALIMRSLLALRGWAGMVQQFQQRPDRAPFEAVPATLEDFLALRLLLDRVAAEWCAPRFGHPQDLAGLWTELRDRHPRLPGPGSVARAFLVCQVARLVGLSAHDMRALEENDILRFERAIQSFDDVARRRLFHLAYERRYRIEILDALACHASVPADRSPAPRLQAIFCIDERCESFRRHFEELDAGYQTFGTAGFFAVPMYYQGVDDWHATPLCPIVIKPTHTVVEVPEDGATANHRMRQAVRRRVGQLTGSMSSGSRTLFRGGLLTAVGGALAAVPLVARVAFPGLTAQVARKAAEIASERVPTYLSLERKDNEQFPDGTLVGFDVLEMAGIVRRVLEDIGLLNGFSRLIAVVGHGSSSLNNPHESAYDCGACGGGKGGPNARAFAMMANDVRVRSLLAEEGLAIPATTVFLGCMQDTCANSVVFFDKERLPASHHPDFDMLVAAFGRARATDAQERCRRFDSVPLDVTPADAVRMVEGRSSDLAQVRPELGHATNALCIIGRRERTRGLYLDRRAFLVSYDPTHDEDGAILTRTLAAVGPVGSGINLAYLFSRLDPLGYGCGTKLPHNITGLIGVMDGHASDLRTGLPWQTVEIHEPVRLLIVIDAPTQRILEAAERLPGVQQMVVNRWVQLAAWDPQGGGLSVFEKGAFVPYRPEVSQIATVQSSPQWYGGHRGNLPPAHVLAGWKTAGGSA